MYLMELHKFRKKFLLILLKYTVDLLSLWIASSNMNINAREKSKAYISPPFCQNMVPKIRPMTIVMNKRVALY